MSRSQPPLRVRVYIDGLNLYYGCLKGTPYRWLDVSALVRRLLDPLFPNYTLDHIRYFTANIRAARRDPGPANRQKEYLRALGSLGRLLSIHPGHFLTNTYTYPLADRSGFARVIRSEEKGSDVNLASHLLMDAFDRRCDVALVVSNDSDLVTPIEMVGARFPVSVGVAGPCYHQDRRRPSRGIRGRSRLHRSYHSRPQGHPAREPVPRSGRARRGEAAFRPRRWAPL